MKTQTTITLTKEDSKALYTAMRIADQIAYLKHGDSESYYLSHGDLATLIDIAQKSPLKKERRNLLNGFEDWDTIKFVAETKEK